VSPGVLILIFIPFILLFNLVPVKQFGQMEYILGSTKMLFLIIMIVLNTVLHSMQRVKDRGHFWTYNAPYGFAANNITLADGHTVVTGGVGQLAGMWEAMTTSIFGLIGSETVAITAAGEFGQ
jgi:amino acid transporter